MRLAPLLVLVGCYQPPQPACGFRCGAAAECPSGYACAGDGYCHREGTVVSCPIVDAGIDAFDFWPFILETSPTDTSTGVSIGISPAVKFTEQVNGISSTTFVLVPAVDATVTYDPVNRIATLDPVAPLAYSTSYAAMLIGDITDHRGNPLFGKASWTFKTEHDTMSPSVASVTPVDGSTNVPVDVFLVADFTEQVSHVTGTTFLLSNSPGAVGYVSQTAIKLTPSNQLAPHTLYTATLTEEITDLIGNPLIGAPYSWSFTTGDDIAPPSLVSRLPLVDDTDVPVTTLIRARFDEPVTLAFTITPSVSATLSYTGSTATITPDAPLAAATLYTVTLSSIVDGSGNTLAPQSWSFTTE